MKNVLFLIILLLTYGVASPLVADTAHYEHLTCANGYQDAWSLTIIGDYGCIFEIHGVNCDGKQFAFAGERVPRDADLELPYDSYITGVIDGHPWYAKFQLSSSGGVARAWGQQIDGSYYEIVQPQ